VQLGLFNPRGLKDALATPTIVPLLLTSFISVISFGGYETTVALLLYQVFELTLLQVTLFFAYIGVVLSLVQGGIVRRISGRVSEKAMATVGAILTIVGFLLLAWSSSQKQFWLVMVASGIEVSGFAFMTPSLQSLISRRSDPAKQGGILGVSQGTSALARIIGPLVAVPLFLNVSHTSPYYASIGLMVLGLAALLIGARGGRDYGSAAEGMTKH
jgi:MFS family permease